LVNGLVNFQDMETSSIGNLPAQTGPMSPDRTNTHPTDSASHPIKRQLPNANPAQPNDPDAHVRHVARS
jgi:hypothetical protein